MREAIAAAASGDQVVVASGLQGTIALTVGELEIPRSLSVDGGGRITVDAQGADRLMIVFGTPAQKITTLAGLLLKNGNIKR